ncbi:hypothetical protein [Xylanivirga thermophila]|uniref:hypothetical protein n=1 Tax=Xylanivirga thermophila TaxID=2496273 RepID=UPI00101B8AB2|nr:hypothetical protein [Xylanivirga thermophila]
MEDISNMIQRLNYTEEEKCKAYERLEYIIGQAIEEILNILYDLYPSLKKDDMTVRNYKGDVFSVEQGIMVYHKGIEEKIVLNQDKKLIYYNATNSELITHEMTSEELLNEVGFEKVYINIKQLVRDRIRMNNEEILNYRNQASKTELYVGELKRDCKYVAQMQNGI